MPIWASTPVEEVPQITLQDWAVFELPDGDRHFAGYNVTEREGRASSKIVEFDPATRRGRTNSGRVYQLSGPPRMSPASDGFYTWCRWLQINGINPKDVRDVSSELGID